MGILQEVAGENVTNVIDFALVSKRGMSTVVREKQDQTVYLCEW